MPDIAPNSKNIEIKEKFGLYKLQIKKETGKVIIKRTFQLKSGWIFPENYPRYQKFCIMVKNLEDKLIQFSIKKEELKPN
jgi:hypothetical protein